MNPTELVIIGLGGVGGYFGFKLATHYAGASVVYITFVARGQTHDAVQQNGLTLNTHNFLGKQFFFCQTHSLFLSCPLSI